MGAIPSRCTSRTAAGAPCKATVALGRTSCRWHDKRPAATAKRLTDSARGGRTKAYGALVSAPSIADVLNVDALDLETPAGSRALLAGALRQLARLPFDVRTANALAQVCTAQRAIIESSDLVRCLDALEGATRKRCASH